ncbi:MAG: exopolysaccharide biosynthesis polyprenyl glycosylphosphotransferase, partial [Bacteroidetes bacterium]|nr:exopolysaccharide biosynthesis polyprenyl glycosylphosphotransferase [Bacteroidota bacterium]
VKMNTIYGTPLIEISSTIMPVWQRNVKRIIDLVVSMFVLIFCIPIFIIIAIIIKIDSTGPVFYSHERIGKNGRPFNIYKFRSMEVNAEVGGPALSCDDDNRITRFGNFMRKTRVDEMPQFFNVIIGNMSLVGPRPEREFFINQIVQTAPHYRHLHKVLPGITSWGQVKYGYAENVDEMIERLRYDIIYIENMSLAVDFKIMIYTVLTILRAGGK